MRGGEVGEISLNGDVVEAVVGNAGGCEVHVVGELGDEVYGWKTKQDSVMIRTMDGR